MSNVKTITRAQAIEFAMKLIEDTSDAPEYVAAFEVLDKMHAQLVKPRAKAVSKARLLNENLAERVRDFISAQDGDWTAKELAEKAGIPELGSTQKVTAVCRVACELGYLNRMVQGKRISYTLA